MGERRSSINIQKLNYNSWDHNNRNYKPNYLIDTGLKNEYFNNKTLPFLEVTNKYGTYTKPDFEQIKKKLEENYTKTTGQKSQKSTEFFKESVFNTSEKTTSDHILKMCDELKKQFNITVLNVAHHKDEGHFDKETGKIKVNYHAHMVFINADLETGKSLRLKKADLVKMQTVVAECLELERGQRGSKTVRLDHKQYKQERIKDDILAKNIAKIESDKAYQDVGNFFGKKINKLNNDNFELNKLNISLNAENTELEGLFKALGLDEYKQAIVDNKKQYKDDREALKASGVATQSDYKQLKFEFEQQQQKYKQLINLGKEMELEYNKVKSELDDLKNPKQINNKNEIEMDM